MEEKIKRLHYKLILLLESIKKNKQDIRDCRNFILSPIHYQKLKNAKVSDLVQLYDALMNATEVLDNNNNEVLFALFQAAQVDNTTTKVVNLLRFTYLKSDLVILIRDFLIWKEFEKDKLQKDKYWLATLREHRLHDDFEKNYLILVAELEKNALRNKEYHLAIANINYEYYHNHLLISRTIPPQFEAASKAFRIYGLAQQLEIICMNISNQKVTTSNEIQNETDKYIIESAEMLVEDENALIIKLYLAGYKLLKYRTESAYFIFKAITEAHYSILNLSELHDILKMSLNFCTAKINNTDGTQTDAAVQRKQFLEEAFDWYNFGIKSKAFLINGIIPSATLRNMVTCAIGLEKYEEAKNDIKTYETQLEASAKDFIIPYLRATIDFKQKKFTESIEKLNTLEKNKDLKHQLDIKKTLVCCHYELENEDELEKQLGSFERYLRDNKNKLGNQVENFTNFIKFTKRLAAVAEHEKIKINALLQEIENAPKVAEKTWLVEKVMLKMR